MAENRVTSEIVEVGIERTSAPGQTRVTSEILEVALVQPFAPGQARVTSEILEVGVLRFLYKKRVRSFFMD